MAVPTELRIANPAALLSADLVVACLSFIACDKNAGEPSTPPPRYVDPSTLRRACSIRPPQ